VPPAGEAAHRLSGRQQIYGQEKNREDTREGVLAAVAPRNRASRLAARSGYFGVLGFVVDVLLLGLLFDGLLGLLGFMPVLPDPGGLDVSVVDPVVGAAGRVESPLEPVLPVVPVLVEPVVPVAVEPVVLPEVESLLLAEPLTPLE